MSIDQDGFVKVAATSDVVDGKPKAVKVEGRSIALFQYDGKVFATDNQCPHMGYPLTRGRVRNGVLTCDWHGWSYDLSGGGCFTGGCDDLDTFPVEERNGDVYVNVRDGGSKRSDAHFLLLKEGLFFYRSVDDIESDRHYAGTGRFGTGYTETDHKTWWTPRSHRAGCRRWWR